MVEYVSIILEKFHTIREGYRKALAYGMIGTIVYALHDVLIDWTLHSLHIAFEWFEFGLEELIEHVFHTTRQQTQAIVFYLLLFLGLFICYRLALKLIAVYRHLQALAKVRCAEFKIHLHCFWSDQAVIEKIPFILSGSASVAVMAFFLFS
ncbi:hypothetical protein [Methylosarcina fibrata]|uniref:hypothetical protein n=1 Tax=Methylosarcina fibrata TaxID=105972 RepID=UPI0012FCBDFF|nr:hypothetical protein [Methylosarcina fibrata]